MRCWIALLLSNFSNNLNLLHLRIFRSLLFQPLALGLGWQKFQQCSRQHCQVPVWLGITGIAFRLPVEVMETLLDQCVLLESIARRSDCTANEASTFDKQKPVENFRLWSIEADFRWFIKLHAFVADFSQSTCSNYCTFAHAMSSRNLTTTSNARRWVCGNDIFSLRFLWRIRKWFTWDTTVHNLSVQMLSG